MPLYRHDASVVFYVHIPKTGGTTIEAALRSAGAAEALRFSGKRPYSKSTLQHMHRSVYSDAVSKSFFDWSFTVVRDPFARFASEYKMKVRDSGGTDDVESWARANFARFEEYPYTRDNHIRPQRAFLADHLDLFRFEDGLSRPIEEATNRLGLPMPEVPHAKRGSSALVPATERAIDTIAQFYAADFRELGYDATDFGGSFELIEQNR